jgi:hypothetical protein
VECELLEQPLQGQDFNLSIFTAYHLERGSKLSNGDVPNALYLLYQINYNAVITLGVATSRNSSEV